MRNSKTALWRVLPILLVCLCCLCLAGCRTTYPLTADDTMSLLQSMPERAAAGDTVEVRTDILMDADVRVLVDGAEIPRSHYDSDYWGYTFCMPSHPVTVRLEPAGGKYADRLSALREEAPEVFGLSAFKGLEVYVWEFGPGAYRLGLMEGTNREKTSEELLTLRGFSVADMKEILSTYEDAYATVTFYQNPLSSYMEHDPEAVVKAMCTQLGLAS